MIIFKKFADFQLYIETYSENRKTIGFVPTMGALHKGHMALINASKRDADITVASIFVNPTQFNNNTDFTNYPSTLDQDIQLLEAAGCDILLVPAVEEVYPASHVSSPGIDIGALDHILEGKFRPGHFRGVCQVVNRLLDVVHPDYLFMGQKDYQQCMVIKKLLEQTKSEAKLEIIKTLRDNNGLALSSRNLRLKEPERVIATTIFRTLNMIKNELAPGDVSALKKKAMVALTDAGFEVDYVEIALASDLTLIDIWNGKSPLVALAAATLNNVRLIDNLNLW